MRLRNKVSAMTNRPADRRDADPQRDHPFAETNDAGLAAFASGGSTYSGSWVNMFAVTTGFLRATRCAVPGCGKPRQDPIHAPSGD